MRIVLFILALLPIIVSCALAPRASNTPCFQCPPKDNNGVALTSSHITNGVIQCKYGPNGNDHTCTYKASTGALNGNKPSCPNTADTCTPMKRNLVEVVKRRAKARAAQPQSSWPRALTGRRAIYKNKRAN